MPPAIRQHLALNLLSKTEPVSHLAGKHEIGRKFLYRQKEKITEALEQAWLCGNCLVERYRDI